MSKFIDTHELTLVSGHGAAGLSSFRREKYVPNGGPDGGDGGRGGDIIFHATRSRTSFSHLYSKREIKAENGLPGRTSRKYGKDGADTIIDVPVGTIIKDQNDCIIYDLIKDDEYFTFLKGGLGGRGNAHFATSVNQAPEYAQPGLPGKSVKVKIEMKLIADIGLVGLPNAGKSTFVSVVTNAKPKIADYAFTTLSPNLGIYNLDDETSLVIADIPGIIEGAHEGHGLGLKFLRHIERTGFLFYLIDSMSDDHYQTFLTLRNELKEYSDALYQKDFAIGISKMDLNQDTEEVIRDYFPKDMQNKLYFFSSAAHLGLDKFRDLAYEVKKQI